MRTLIFLLVTLLLSGCSEEVPIKRDAASKAPTQTRKPDSPQKHKGSFTVELAESYIARAKELCDKHLQNDTSVRSSFKKLLNMMVVREVGLYAEMDSATVDSTKNALFALAKEGKFIFALRDFSAYNKDPHKRRSMTFEREVYDESRGSMLMIEADRDMVDFSSDRDVNACILLHELTHVIQAHMAMNKEPRFIDNYIGNENAAWHNQCYVYFAEHPEMLEPILAVDCENFGNVAYREGYSEESLPDIGPKHTYFSMLYYKACGREYLKRVYEVKE